MAESMPEVVVERKGVEQGDAHDLVRRHKESLFPSVGLFYEEPIELRRGEGQLVYDGDGRQYLDFFGGITFRSTCTRVNVSNT